jgi:hypothetical protein
MSHGLIVVPRSLRMFQRERHSNKPVDVGSKDRRVENVLSSTRMILPSVPNHPPSQGGSHADSKMLSAKYCREGGITT